MLLSGPCGGGADDGGGGGGGGMIDEEACQCKCWAGLGGEIPIMNEGHVGGRGHYKLLEGGWGGEEGWKGTGTKGVYNDGDCGMSPTRSARVANMRWPRGTTFYDTAMASRMGDDCDARIRGILGR